MHRVVVLAIDGVMPFELGIPGRIFDAARSPGRNAVQNGNFDPLYSVITCTVDGRPVRTAGDFTIGVEHDAAALTNADTVIVPPSHGLAEQGTTLPGPLAEALAGIRPGARLVSICTGTFVLAAAGLLTGRRVTTHWRKAELLQRMYPDLKVDPDVLFVDEGDVLTSAGVAAGVDLCLHLVRRDHGSDVANGVARTCVVPPWRDGGQAQYLERPVPEPSMSTTTPVREWALNRLESPIGLDEMAAEARMSRRTFTRRFREEVGLSPGQWITGQRVERARQLLETTDLPIDHVAHLSGFATAETLRLHFRGHVGVSPHAYRNTFTRRADPKAPPGRR